ncbi:murein L,D-transpeptidase catalytic domain family protein [Aureispira anguillae]|uniref:Murein L,D-transpeptidase catalytic domain family protein n=1 Tax=Aureispira anguillae TaxID=2864201 RepID=A0A915YDT3_9BACT|nr:murein L,D-transpeptidase catalytic domain family protein [Aureispira anguillae]BDS11249.1 murein L,D-transpeptidase catalytic domain family protein [Aureispira anguillae]
MNLKAPLFSFLLFCSLIQCTAPTYRTKKIKQPSAATEQLIKTTYQEAKLTSTLPFDLFRTAMIGFYNIEQKKQSDKIAIIDFSKPSTKERFYVIDLDKKKLLHSCLVAHGKNSGNKIPSDFSNTLNSKKSSLGFFLTAETYQGKHGFSLRLDGIEKGINHNARKRSIVIHGADYVSTNYIKKQGRLGRSWGCPALPLALSEEIIQSISNGTCLFIYGKNASYFKHSNYILPI